MRLVVELSGGADSALALHLAGERYPDAEIHSLFVDYGQACGPQETAASHAIHLRLGIPNERWHKVVISGLIQMADVAGLSSIYMPLRNLVLSAAACSLADRLGADLVISGSKGFSKVQGDPHSFKDSTLPFYALLSAAAAYAQESSGRLRVEAILAEGREHKMTKAEVLFALRQLDLLDLVWNCYLPTAKGMPCGGCKNCLQMWAFRNSG